MDYTLFVKSKFLSTTIGNFSDDVEKTNYKGLEKIVTQNTIFGMGKFAMKICRKGVKSAFNEIDGIPVSQGNVFSVRKDGYVDKDELYQLIKNSYKITKGEDITNEEISKMTIKQALDLVIDSWDKMTQNK